MINFDKIIVLTKFAFKEELKMFNSKTKKFKAISVLTFVFMMVMSIVAFAEGEAE